MSNSQQPELGQLKEPEQTKFQHWTSQFVGIFAIVSGLYFLIYVSGILEALRIYIPTMQQTGLFIFCTLTILWLRPGEKATGKIRWYDLVLLAFTWLAAGYPAFFPHEFEIAFNVGRAGTFEIIAGILIVFCLLEAMRRRLGWIATLIFFLFFIHPFISIYLPGILHGRGYSLARVFHQTYLSDQGILGSVTKLASTMILVFVMFGSFLNITGGGEWFIKFALAIVGGMTGGAAKAGVIASALFGMISGAPSANVAVAGNITIPLMKRIGYSPTFAGGVEAAASTGGQIMPPVMGAVAFIIADWLNIRYWDVCVAAFIPALLFYAAMYVMVHQEAKRCNLPRLSRSELPPLWSTIKEGWYWFLPILTIILLMGIMDFTPEKAGVISILLIIGLSFFKKESRMTITKFFSTVRDGMYDNQIPGIACICVGIIVASLYLTGIGVALSGYIVDWAGGNLIVLVILCAITSLILGLGLPTIPAYVMVVTLVAPAMIQLGVAPLVAHLFVFYWAMLGFITPPEATAAFMAAAIAKASPYRVGWYACRMAILAFLVPFAFIYKPALTLQGPLTDIILQVVLVSIGTYVLSCGIIGYVIKREKWAMRIIMIIGGVALILFSGVVQFIGIAIVIVAVVLQLLAWLRERKTESATSS